MLNAAVAPQARKFFVLAVSAVLVAAAAAVVTLGGLTSAQTGNGAYDTDGDKLIEISYLEQLDALRYDHDGDGAAEEGDRSVYALAFPVAGNQRVCNSGCVGYELTKSLDFNQAASYKSGSINTAWTSTTGDGWTPIVYVDSQNKKKPYNAQFQGGGYTISNLYANGQRLNRTTGLFDSLGAGASVDDLGLLKVSVTGGYNDTGALAGRNAGDVTGAYATGSVSGKGDVGGLVGNNVAGGKLTKSYASATVSSSENNVGGLVGDNFGSIVRSYASGDVTGDKNFVGGLAGYSVGSISYSYATGKVEGENQSALNSGGGVGGLLGKNLGTITASYATGGVEGRAEVGGLAGANVGTIKGSYASGSVSASGTGGDTAGRSAGGLVGHHSYNEQSSNVLRSSYATGSVSGSSYVGGLIGDGNAKLVNSYSTGAVTGTTSTGGLVGSSSLGKGNVTASYWDTATSGISSGSADKKFHGQGKTTADMKTPTSATELYQEWTGGAWDFGTAGQYPALKADVNNDGTATVGEFGSQRSSAQTPAATATPTPAPTATPTPTPTPQSAQGQSDGGGAGIASSTVAIVLSSSTVSVKEGGAASYTVKLNSAPWGNVTVALSLPTTGEVTADKYSLTFTPSNFNTAQTVTLSAAEDDDKYDDTVLYKHTAAGGGFQDVTANITVNTDDNDNDGTLTASDATATTVLLTMSGYSGNWWYQRAGWNECIGPVSTSTYRVTGLAVNASSYINAYHGSACGSAQGITQGNRFQTANPTLTASDITHNSVKLTISDHWILDKDGPWRYGVAGGWCSGATYGARYTGLDRQPENTTYTFGAFSDSTCHVGVTPAITFTTLLTPTNLISLTASDPSATSVTLTMAGFDNNNWWYQRAGWSECQGPVNSSSYRARGLAPDASSYINAYRTSSCGTNDGIAQSNRFDTLVSPVLTASNITDSSARLTISAGWDVTNDGPWHYGRTGDWCSGSIHGQNYTDLTGLTRYTTYQFAAYSDASCSVAVSAQMSFRTLQTPVSVSNLNTSGSMVAMNFGYNAGDYERLAVAFLTGSHGNGYQLHSVTAKIQRGTDSVKPTVRAKLYSNTSGSVPNQRQATLSTETIASGQDTTFTCTPGNGNNCNLNPNTIYQIVIEVTPQSCSNTCLHSWKMTSSGDETNSPSNAGWTIGNEYSFMETGRPWVRIWGAGIGRMQVNAGMK